MIGVRTPGLGVGLLGRLPEQYCAWVDLCLRGGGGGFQPTWREVRPLEVLFLFHAKTYVLSPCCMHTDRNNDMIGAIDVGG